MSFVGIANFITVTEFDGTVPSKTGTAFRPYTKFQNAKPNVGSGFPAFQGHDYLSFLYQGAARNRSGDNMTSSLILANSEISMNYAIEAVQEKYHIKVKTCLMRTDFGIQKILTEEQWLASSLSYDPESIEVILSSAIDAVGASSPDRVLTQEIVGHLPVTGSLQNR